MMESFKLFINSGKGMPPIEFINLFNKEMNAQDTFIGTKAYVDEDDALVSYTMKPFQDKVYVSDLQVEPRGIAAIKFLQKLTSMADKHQVKLSCISEPLKVKDKVNKKRLTNLYKKFGFKPVSPSSDNLVRMPR